MIVRKGKVEIGNSGSNGKFRMNPTPELVMRTRRILRWILTISLLLAAGFAVVAVALKSLGHTRAQLLLTFAGLAVAALLADIQLVSIRKHLRWVVAGLVAVLFSMTCYLLLVWAGWQTESVLWRCWWIPFVASITVTHVLLLRRAGAGHGDLAQRATPVCVVLTGILIGGLALQRDLLAGPTPFYLGLIALPGAGSVIGSFIAWARWWRLRPKSAPVSPRTKLTLLITSYVGVLVVGLYIGRIGALQPRSFEGFPSALGGLTSEQLDTRIQVDLERLKTVAAGIDRLEQELDTLDRQFRARIPDERLYYRPEEEETIRWKFATYLSYRAALLRIIATYIGFHAVRDPEQQARCFMLGYAAASRIMRASLVLARMYRDDEMVRRMLNEAEPLWGIPPQTFDRIYQNVASRENLKKFEEMGLYFEHRRNDWREGGIWPEPEFTWLESMILDGLGYIRENQPHPYKVRLEMFMETIKQDAYKPVYAAQSLAAMWMGDTRIVERPPLISVEQIKNEIEPKLEPGDILLARHNWYLSNAFLPGFWPHAALYVGRLEDLRRLGLADDPEVRSRWDEYLRAAPDGEPHSVIESVSEGVIFSSLTEVLHADYIAVLRPRLSQDEKREAIRRAFRQHGKPYDFEFDFFTSDKLVCTELVYRAYEGFLNFNLVRVMGRDTLPADQIVRKFAAESERRSPELDFVLFVDWDPRQRRTRMASVEDFSASTERPSGFNE